MLHLTGLVLATSLVAQAPPSNYEHLKPVEWMIGTWQAEMEADEDSPVAKKGDKLDFTMTSEWALNKNVIESVWSLKKGEFTLITAKVMRGWDPVEKQIVHGAFDSIGGHGHGMIMKDGDDWHLKNSVVRPDGTKESGTIIISNMTDDSFNAREVDRKRDGEDLPDGAKITVKRVK
jgi:hypothetical protein